MLTVLLSIPVIFALSYIILKPRFVEWSLPDRGFISFEKEWPKIFTVAGVGSLLFSIPVFYFSSNPALALILGVLAGFFGIAAWTDSRVSKIPGELSKLTTWFAFVAGIVALFTVPISIPHGFTRTSEDFFLRINPDDVLMVVGIGFILMLVGFLVWLRNNNIIGLICIGLAGVGFFFIMYAPLTLVMASADPYWAETGYRLACLAAFLAFIIAFDLGAHNYIGGADISALYAMVWGLSWWTGPYLLFVSLIAAFAVQTIMHIIAKPLNIGTIKEVKNGAIRQKFVNKKWVKAGNTLETAPVVHKANAVPFLPSLVTVVMIGALTIIITFTTL